MYRKEGRSIERARLLRKCPRYAPIGAMLRHLLALAPLVAASLLLHTKDAAADICAEPQNAEVIMTPPTDCLKVTSMPACNGGVELAFDNQCGVDIVGIERKSSVQNLPAGYPPLQECIQAWQDATDAGMQPPFCVLIHGQMGTAFAQVSDTLVFDYSGMSLTLEIKAIESPDDSSDNGPGDDGCSMTPASPSKGASAGAFLAAMALGAIAIRRRRSPS